jgi:hypothetical protein
VLIFIAFGIRKTNEGHGTVNAFFGLWSFGGDLPQQNNFFIAGKLEVGNAKIREQGKTRHGKRGW